jgi:hypothetical protein
MAVVRFLTLGKRGAAMVTQTNEPKTGTSGERSQEIAAQERDEQLDRGLEDSFPASDPVSITQLHTRLGAPGRGLPERDEFSMPG